VRIEAPRGVGLGRVLYPSSYFFIFRLAVVHFGVFWAIAYKAYRLKVKTESKSSFVYQLVSYVPLPPKNFHFCLAMVHFSALWPLVSMLV